MANGYRPGAYFEQFLARLPQIYQARQNLQLQRDRFEYAKEQDYKDDIYRSQVVQTNEERNRLAREQFTQKKLENTQDEAYRTQYLENAKATQEHNEFNQNFTALAGNKEAQTYLLKQKYKDNPAMLDMIDEHRDVTESMAFQVRALEGMSPLDAIRSGRPLYASEYLDDKLKGQLDTTLQGKEEDLKFTLKDLEGTPLGPEYAMYYERFINKDKYLPAGTSATQRMQYDELHLKKMDEIYEQAKEEQIIGGPWNEPFFENMDVEGVDDNEIEEILVDWDKDTIPNYVDISPYGEESQTETAGFPMKAEPETKKEEPLFVEDEAGLESLVKEYSPQASLGWLEKAAGEGSVMKPVSNEVYKAIDGGLDILDSSSSKIFNMVNAGDIDKQVYADSATKFKKTLKDMYNLYLRLDPEKGEYQGKLLGAGNEMMRKKIKERLMKYKSTGERGKWSPYRYDKEIQSILKQIKF